MMIPSSRSICFQLGNPLSINQGTTINNTATMPIPSRLNMVIIKTLSFIIDFHPPASLPKPLLDFVSHLVNSISIAPAKKDRNV